MLKHLLGAPPEEHWNGPAIKIAVDGDQATVTANTPRRHLNNRPDDIQVAKEALEKRGLNPDEWEVVGVRASDWTTPNGQAGQSTRHTFRRRQQTLDASPVEIDTLKQAALDWRPPATQPTPPRPKGLVVALGDMQIGKIDSIRDGRDLAVEATVDCLEQAFDMARAGDYTQVAVTFLGDHLEGFEAQGGAQAWRTPVPLTDQLAIVRRIMMRATLGIAAAVGPENTLIAAVPGNHGEVHRMKGKGLTRYSDNFDIDCLRAVQEAASINPRLEKVQFLYPGGDELVCGFEIEGTRVMLAHGHQWKPGRHMTWWQGQAFHNPLAAEANLLLAGHLHHWHLEESGPRLFAQAPALEAESTWWRHRTGTIGAPGILAIETSGGYCSTIRKIIPRIEYPTR